MESKTSRPDEAMLRRIDHATFAASLAARRSELGNPGLPRNSGTRRTPGKRALLAAIAEAGGKW